MTTTRLSRPVVKDRVLAWLLLLTLLLPSGNLPFFNGLPLSRLSEFVALVLVLPLLFGRAVRRLYLGRPFLGLRLRRQALLGICLGVLLLKICLLRFGGDRSFSACYRSLTASPASTGCEMSWENPFSRRGATRFDPFLNFGPANWNFSFLNSIRFNFYPWVNGNPLRDRLPFTATWTASVAENTPINVRADYVGEGHIRIDDTTWPLQREYREVATRFVSIPPGTHHIVVHYTFDDGYRVGDGIPPGPNATFRLRHTTDAQGAQRPLSPLTPAPPPWPWTAGAWFLDGALILVFTDVTCFYVRLLRREAWVAFFLALSIPLLFINLGFSHSWKAVALLVPLFAFLIARYRRTQMLVAYLSVVFLTCQRVELGAPDYHAVQYRSAGEDCLTYESLARSILDHRSFEAGEAVFYYQPFSRYETFVFHLLLGDGDTLIAMSRIALMNLSVFWMIARIWPRSRHRFASTLIAASVLFPLLGVLNSPTVVDYIRVGASEWLTWSALPAALACLFWPSTSSTQWTFGVVLLGVSLITRTNQAPALLATFVIHQMRVFSATGRMWWRGTAVFGAIACLPLLHNVCYGHVLVLATTSAGIPENLVLTPKAICGFMADRETLRFIVAQLKGITCVGQNVGVVAVLFHTLQVMWLITSVLLLAARRQGVTLERLLLVLPIAYLGVHIFYQVGVYYPRHIVIGHIAMGLVATYGMCSWLRGVDVAHTVT